MEDKKKWVGWVILAVITVGAAVALATVNRTTEPIIEQQAGLAFEEGIRTLFPEADAGSAGIVPMQDRPNEENQTNVRFSIMQSGEKVGRVIRTEAAGYAGPVEVLTGIESSGVLRGIVVGGASFQETEGIGSKVKEESFTSLFVGKEPPLTLGEDVDAIAGATISSKAVVTAVNDAYALNDGNESRPDGAITGVPEMSGQPISISTIGYAGPVLVQMRLGDNREILAIEVGSERFLETAGIGSQVQEDAFLSQFIGKTPPLSETDVDLISGATISSRAVLQAVNEADEFLEK